MTTEARRVRRLRLALGMTQEAFAEAASMARPNLVAVETGRRPLPGGYSRRVALAGALGFDVVRLCEYLAGRLGLRTLVKERAK